MSSTEWLSFVKNKQMELIAIWRCSANRCSQNNRILCPRQTRFRYWILKMWATIGVIHWPLAGIAPIIAVPTTPAGILGLRWVGIRFMDDWKLHSKNDLYLPQNVTAHSEIRSWINFGTTTQYHCLGQGSMPWWHMLLGIWPPGFHPMADAYCLCEAIRQYCQISADSSWKTRKKLEARGQMFVLASMEQRPLQRRTELRAFRCPFNWEPYTNKQHGLPSMPLILHCFKQNKQTIGRWMVH